MRSLYSGRMDFKEKTAILNIFGAISAKKSFRIERRKELINITIEGGVKMEWKTHMLTGVVAGYVVTGGDFTSAAIGGIAAIVSDLDEPKSVFGKLFFPVSALLNKVFGHRTFTHSLLFTILAGGFLTVFTNPIFGLAAAAGILAHILGDMATGKVQLFYPHRKKFGIPVPPYIFLLNDRICRGIMTILVVIFGAKELFHYL